MVSKQRPCTDAQWLDFLHQQFGGAYTVCVLVAPGSKWKATALFGQHDELCEWSPSELAEEIMHHRYRNYHGSKGRE
jgi:hypothetical protein